MLKFNYIAWQAFGQISADSALSTQPLVLLCFHIGTGGFAVAAERAFRRPCFRQSKQKKLQPQLPLPISHIMMTLIIPMHPTKFKSNLTFFFPSPPAAAVSMTT